MGDMEKLKLKVLGFNGDEIYFLMKKTAKMEKLKITYSQRIGIHVFSLKFCFNSIRILDDDTPESLEMEQDDVIEVLHDWYWDVLQELPWLWDEWVETNSLTYRQRG